MLPGMLLMLQRPRRSRVAPTLNEAKSLTEVVRIV